MRVLDEEVFITILAMLRLGHYTAGNIYVYVCVWMLCKICNYQSVENGLFLQIKRKKQQLAIDFI